MKIAICDDDKHELLQTASLVESYRHKRKVELAYVCFQSAMELLYSIRSGDYDVILLDVLMPGINGMQAAHEIREHNGRTEIVFLTSSPEYAVESYSVRANYYLLKPASEEKIFPILDRLADNFKKPEDALRIKTQTSVFNLPYSKIEYVEINAKTLYFYLTDSSVREIFGSLADFEQLLLARFGFMKVHRSFIVNLQWTQELRQNELVTMTGRHVPVSRALHPKVRTAYMQLLFAEAAQLNLKKEGIQK